MAMKSLHNLPVSRNTPLIGRYVSWSEGELNPNLSGQIIDRGKIIEVLESPLILVTRIGRGDDLTAPPCMFVFSMVEVRSLHFFDTIEEEECWYAWSQRKEPPQIEGRSE